MMIKGICEAAADFQHVNPDIALRQIDLVRAAISADRALRPLRGQPPTIEDLESVALPPSEALRSTPAA